MSGLYHLDILGDFDDFGDFNDFGGFDDFGGDFGGVDGGIAALPPRVCSLGARAGPGGVQSSGV